MMRSRAMIVLALFALGAGCRNDSDATGHAPLRVPSKDELRSQGRFELGDSMVVALLASPGVPGRVIYEPPEDLSLANAMRMRPDLVRPDTTRRDTSTQRTRRDSTGGDATADTSGGAARPKRP